MNSDQRFVANPLARTIERELRPGEILIWIGQPNPKRFSREVIRSCLFQLALMAIFIPVSLFVISRISRPRRRWFQCFYSWAASSYFAIGAPWRYPQRILQTIYAITDKRALVYQGFGWSLLWLQALPDLYNTLCSFDARKIRGQRRIQRYEGRTDLIFGGEGHDHMTGRGQIRDWVQVGFLGLADIDDVDLLLENHFANVDVGRP